MENMSKKAALMGKELNTDQLASFAKQGAALTTMIYNASNNLDGAKEIAQSFTTQIIESEQGMRNMLVGTADDMSQFQTELAVLGMDVGSSMKLMEQGPMGVMQVLQDMAHVAKKDEKKYAEFAGFVGGRMQQVFGDNTDLLMNFLRNSDTAIADTGKTVMKATADLGKLAKEGYASSMTLQESFDKAKERVHASFRAIGRSAATNFVADSTKAFGEFGASLTALAKDGGPMGKFVTKLSEIDQLGVLALVPRDMRAFAVVAGDAMEKVAPLGTALGSLGFRFDMLLSPVALVGSAVALLGIQFGGIFMEVARGAKSLDRFGAGTAAQAKNLKGFADRAAFTFDLIGQKIESFVQDVERKVVKFDLVGFFDKMLGGSKGGAGKIADRLLFVLQDIFTSFSGELS